MIEYSERPYNGQIIDEGSTPTIQSVWSALHQADPYALPTQTLEWLTIAKGSRGSDASQFFTLPNGQQLLLPLVKSSSFSAFSSGGSMPQHWGYGGLISRQELTAVDVQHTWKMLRQLGWQYIRIRPNPLQAAIWENGRIPQVKAIPKRAHVLDLTSGFDHVWEKQFKSGMRRNVRKAEKAGLTVTCDTTGELVPDFYALFEASIARWGQQQNEPQWLARWRGLRRDPISKFERIIKEMNGLAKLWLAKQGDEPVAAILVLQCQNAHYTRGVMNKPLANKTRANDYLHFLAIKAACEAGCFSYHMGETGQSTSLAQFKEKFGARPFPYAEYYLERLPLTAVETRIKTAVKRMISFKD